MPMTAFCPSRHGFHFANRFINRFVQVRVPGIAGLAEHDLHVETYGRCGGMAYAALDYYLANLPIPSHVPDDFPSTGVPADGTRLSDYILWRLFETYLVTSALKFITWTSLPDEGTPLYKGVTRATKEDEFLKLRRRINAGKPVPLGLVCATDLRDIGRNHQVVAYGYDYGGDGSIRVQVYDNNYPDADDVVLTSGPSDPPFHESTGQDWRGFFVQEYRPQSPAYRDLALASGIVANPDRPMAGQRLECRWSVRNYGDYPAHFRRLGLTVIGPSGEALGDLLEAEGDTPLQPGEERQVSVAVDALDAGPGQCTIAARYLTASNQWLDLPAGVPEATPRLVVQVDG